jgi:hypothetical protein
VDFPLELNPNHSLPVPWQTIICNKNKEGKLKISKTAEELTKKFISSAACGMNSESLQNKMFWFYYLKIAEKMGKNAITKRVIMAYWLKIHNEILIKRLKAGHIDPQRALDCMVRIGGWWRRPFCFHGGKCICHISKFQARLLNGQLRRFYNASQI